MDALTAGDVRAMHAAVDYPKNQSYDPVTMKPLNEVTARRAPFLEAHVPQLWNGGDSLLDLGCSKGYVSLLLADRFREVVGYELGRHACQAAEAARQFRNAANVRFVNKPMRLIEVSKHAGCRRFEVVYAGSVHHHAFKDCLLHGAPPHLGLKKLAALTGRYLILDGPLEVGADFSLNTWRKAYGWSDEQMAAYTLEEHDRALAPAFERITDPVEDERGRQCVVYERKGPDVPLADVSNPLIANIIAGGTPIAANKAREAGSVVRCGNLRLKIDRGVQNEAVLGILNHLPDHFPETMALVTDKGAPAGDVTKWVDGEPIRDMGQLVEPWLRLNNVLAAVGLLEIHFKLGDFVRRDGKVIDVDVDMVNHCENVALAHMYLESWRPSAARGMGKDLANYVASNLADEWVFQVALERFQESHAHA